MIVSNLKSCLAEKRMTMKKLHEKTGISINQLSLFARNKVGISLHNLNLICKELKISDINKILKIVDDDFLINFEKKNLIELKVS